MACLTVSKVLLKSSENTHTYGPSYSMVVTVWITCNQCRHGIAGRPEGEIGRQSTDAQGLQYCRINVWPDYRYAPLQHDFIALMPVLEFHVFTAC